MTKYLGRAKIMPKVSYTNLNSILSKGIQEATSQAYSHPIKLQRDNMDG